MNYVFFALIVFSLLSGMIFKRKGLGIVLLLFIAVLLIGKFPKLSVTAAKDGINLWIFVVLPSLLPFFIINDMLISLKVPENISRLFAPAAKVLFNTSGYGAYAFIMSIFSGYPTGAKITANLIEDKKITHREGQKILTFSSTSGPLFLIGVVGASMLGSTSAGYILILSHMLGAVINGFVYGLLLDREKLYRYAPAKGSNQNKPISQMLSEAIMNSLYTSGLIGGYIILFAVINKLLDKVEFFKILSGMLHSLLHLPSMLTDIISSFLQASLEMSNGSKIIAELSISLEAKLILLSFIIAFSGLSIIGQVSGLISKTKISLSLYVLSKISHGLFSSLLCFLFLRMHLFTLATVSQATRLHIFPARLDLVLILLLVLLMFLNIISRKIKEQHIHKIN